MLDKLRTHFLAHSTETSKVLTKREVLLLESRQFTEHGLSRLVSTKAGAAVRGPSRG